MNFNSSDFDEYKEWILKARKNDVSWEQIRDGYRAQSLDEFLQDMSASNFWNIDVATWQSLVDYMFAESCNGSSVLDVNKNDKFYILDQEDSAWVIYKDKLLHDPDKQYTQEAVDSIERSCIETLKCLSLQTDVGEPRKGLVVGSVQSGKTGHMAGLMAMAADWGWNMFIVFSGSLENLRVQTEARLVNDLMNHGAKCTWIPIPRSEVNGFVSPGFRTRDLNLTDNSRIKYLSVCLKNSKRMTNLLEWIHSDQNALSNMRILLIDDEADQATINTGDISLRERSTLNEALCNLVNARTSAGTETRGFKAMNYVAYTATPYANLLNEASRESLYPRHFITTLTPSKEYFGPQQIFGDSVSGYNGLDIIRNISTYDVDNVNDLYSKGNIEASDMPESLADSLCWYLCCVANMRNLGYKKPLSMLVHTSMMTEHHSVISKLISSWLSIDRSEILGRCRNVWNRETHRFGMNEFSAQYPDYAKMSSVRDYQDFDVFVRYIDELLDKVRPMRIDDKGNFEYHSGIHLCVDNSTETINPNGEYVRLLYPETDQEFATAFIVVGGNTLSRGLTIKGLVSTYFFRTVKQADTLMQMGRWFGYRRDYELLPRIWMTDDAREKFLELTQLDSDLRHEIYSMSILGQTPDKYAVRMRNLPSYIRITARNRMQGAVEADLDFSGTLLQTTYFDNDSSILEQNLNVTESFISSLGSPSVYDSYSKSNVIWQNIDFDIIKEYLYEYRFNDSVKRLNDIGPLIDWLEQMHKSDELYRWNVVLCGVQNRSTYTVGTVSVGKIFRSKKKSPDNIIYIQTLTSGSDFISDLDRSTMSFEILNMIKAKVDTRVIRSKSELGRCPQLLIYVIDKDSRAEPNTSRFDLDASHDIIGLAINIPGHANCNNNVRTIHVNLQD